MNAEAEEYELARRARGGDREALTELVARTRLRLFALAYAELRHYYSTKVITPKDLPGLPKALKGHSFAALDECILGRSALEVLIHLRANPESAENTICLPCSHPTEFMASAYFSAGLDRLVCKEDPSDIAHLAQPATSSASMWRSFTGRARNTIIFASASLQSPYKSHTVLLHSFRTITLCSPPERCRGRPRPSSAPRGASAAHSRAGARKRGLSPPLCEPSHEAIPSEPHHQRQPHLLSSRAYDRGGEKSQARPEVARRRY
jgi:hypothetical protein